MYFVVSVLIFFFIPPLGAGLLILGIGVNLLINLVDYLHSLKRRLSPKTINRPT